jgi:hypothetical protein
MTRYGVYTHGYGRPIVKRGPAAGCADFPKHEHTLLNPRPVGLTRAKALADAQAVRAVVVPWMESGPVYDNGKQPGTPEGWIPEVRRGGRI